MKKLLIFISLLIPVYGYTATTKKICRKIPTHSLNGDFILECETIKPAPKIKNTGSYSPLLPFKIPIAPPKVGVKEVRKTNVKECKSKIKIRYTKDVQFDPVAEYFKLMMHKHCEKSNPTAKDYKQAHDKATDKWIKHRTQDKRPKNSHK